MIAFKKIFGIWLVLASGTVAAMDSNSREGKRRIVEDDAGVPVAVPVAAALPVVPAPVKANGGARRAKLGNFKRQRAAEPLPLPVAVPELDTGDLTEEDFALDPAELDLLKEAKRRLDKNEASRKWREANPERIRAVHKVWYEANKDHKRDTNKAWYKANPEKTKAYREASKERAKAWREANPEKTKAYREANKERAKAWREANSEKTKAWREANKDYRKATLKAWRKANQQRLKVYNKRAADKAKKEAAAPKSSANVKHKSKNELKNDSI